MSQTLNLELSDSTFTAIQRRAEEVGTSPAELVKALLERQYHANLSIGEKQNARERFEHHFGEIDSGYPIGADNETIDRELANAYADNNETG